MKPDSLIIAHFHVGVINELVRFHDAGLFAVRVVKLFSVHKKIDAVDLRKAAHCVDDRGARQNFFHSAQIVVFRRKIERHDTAPGLTAEQPEIRYRRAQRHLLGLYAQFGDKLFNDPFTVIGLRRVVLFLQGVIRLVQVIDPDAALVGSFSAAGAEEKTQY